ncbi:MAG: chemotaxis response regulator protein-glutamate methylesterase [Gemmatimonadaceae bacterium]
MTKKKDPIRVLIVDDSAVIRGTLGKIIDAEEDLQVATTAPNGRMALDALRHTPVDVVLLDIEMPEMDGLTALPQILAQHPDIRVVMASSLTQSGAAITMQALSLGATDYIAKPAAKLGTAALSSAQKEIVSKIRAIGRAGRAQKGKAAPSASRPATALGARPLVSVSTALAGAVGSELTPRIIAIAASTGGPNALADVLSGLPADFPLPIVITQHMPPLFTGLLAQRLARDAKRPAVEAIDGMEMRPGVTYVAPGDYHMLVQTHEGKPYLRLTQTAPENHCRPAADPMLRSVAAVYGASALTVVLTGMGEDGKRGCEEIRQRGGRVIAQDEATSVVWGMPGAVATAGLAHYVLPLPEIAHKIASLCLVTAS